MKPYKLVLAAVITALIGVAVFSGGFRPKTAEAYSPPMPQSGYYSTYCAAQGQYCALDASFPAGQWYIDVFGWWYDTANGQMYQIEDTLPYGCSIGTCYSEQFTQQNLYYYWSAWQWYYQDGRQDVISEQCYPLEGAGAVQTASSSSTASVKPPATGGPGVVHLAPNGPLKTPPAPPKAS